MNTTIIFAFLAWFCVSLYAILNKIIWSIISPLFWAILYSFFAILFWIVFFIFSKQNITSNIQEINLKTFLLILLAWITVLWIDYFTLKVYESGTFISIVWPIMSATTILIPIFYWLYIWEKLDLLKILWILLILAWALLISYNK